MISQQIHKIIIICLSVSIGFVCTAFGTGIQRSRVFEIEAAFLVQFSKYITWPAHCFKTERSPVIIGIMGRDPFGTKIDRIARSFKVGKRIVEVLRINNAMTGIDKCHILYISSEKSRSMVEIQRAVIGQSVLLVSDKPDFLNQGGIIDFIISGTKIRFNISLTNGRRAGLKISSQLLKVANKVQ